MNRHDGSLLRGWLLAALVLPLLPAGLAAQQDPDFLFREPRVSLGVRLGYAMPKADGRIFDFVTDSLTLSRGDFNTASWGLVLGVRATDRLDVAVNLDLDRSTTQSEFRYWVDTNELPIEQETTFFRRSFSVSAKQYLTAPGRAVSRFAWVPAAVAPYVGAGLGVMWYSFEQNGDWVDSQTLDIFTDDLRASGSTPLGQLFAGADVSVGPRFVLSGEARYAWSRADLGGDYSGFGKIDLGGFAVTAGLSVRF